VNVTQTRVAKFGVLPFLFLCLSGCSAAPEDSPEDSGESRLGENAATIVFAANRAPTVRGKLVAGTRVTVEYDAARSGCSGSTNDGKPAWSTTGRFRVGGGLEHDFFAAGHNPDGSPQAILPSFVLPARVGDLELWFETGGLWGCHVWDTDFGRNFHFPVSAPSSWPGWIGASDVVISRASCDGAVCEADRRPLDAGFTFESWARQRAVFRLVEFRVWKEGVTDRDGVDLSKTLDVQLHYRFGHAGAFEKKYVDFDARVGNDARYAFDLRALDPFFTGGALTCPTVPVTRSADGQDLVAELELYVTVNGAELRPGNVEDAVFRGTFADARASYSSCPGL
jgi:hypothetical protein